jgi:PAS domain S-box-containing protein
VRLADLLELPVLQRLAEANYSANGMPIGIVDARDGSVLVGSGWQDICTMYHRAHPETLARCRESDEEIQRHLSVAAPCEYVCKNGLRDIGVPIAVEGVHLATLFLGQFFYAGESPDRGFFVLQARQFGFDEEAYLAALDRVPVFTRAATENILRYNVALASFVSDLAEAALRRRRAELNAESLARFPQENPDPVFRLADDLTVRYANEAAREALASLGLERGERAPPLLRVLASRALAGGRRVQGELESGDRSFAVSFVPTRGEVNVYAHDITARVLAETALRERDERLREAMQRLESLLENSPLAVIEWSSADFRIARWSDEAARMFGWSAAESVGKRIDELPWVHPEDQPLVAQAMGDMLSGKRPRNVNRNRNLRKDGSVVHCEWYNSTVTDAAGHLVAVLSLVLDVTERKRVEQELREADRAKDEFLGVLSHELRNPLAPLRNALTVLDRAEPAGPQAARARQVAGRQLSHLTRLVDDLLDVSRIVRGKVELRRERLDVGELTRRAAEDHRALMHERGLDLVVETPEDPVWVDGDETRLAQIVGNLLHNAAKFTPAGGRVKLSAAPRGDAVEIRVADSGAGIDEALLERIFEPFVQAKQSLARTDGGLGLGLAMVRALVELHGGSVAAASGGAGQGAQLTVRLPLPPAPPAGDRPAAMVASSPRVRRRRVLVVDDNHDAAETLAELVQLLGHETEVAFDGPGALARVRASPPDVLLCDIGLPGMSGYEVAQALRSDRRFDGVRLVAVTGYVQAQDRQRALEAGFQEHLAKPPDPALLERLLLGSPTDEA